MDNLAALYLKQGRYDKAEPLQVRALELYRRVLGDEHKDTLIAMHNLAMLYKNQGQYDKAEPLLARMVAGFRRVYPDGHWFIGTGLGNHGDCLMNMKRLDEAEAALLESHKILEAKLGANHERTVRTVRRLVKLYNQWGKPEQAADYRARLPVPERQSSTDAQRTTQD